MFLYVVASRGDGFTSLQTVVTNEFAADIGNWALNEGRVDLHGVRTCGMVRSDPYAWCKIAEISVTLLSDGSRIPCANPHPKNP